VKIAKEVKEARRLLADPDCLEEDRDKDVGGIKKRGLHHGRASKLAEPARLKKQLHVHLKTEKCARIQLSVKELRIRRNPHYRSQMPEKPQ
jgi:hypothetical protein